MRNTALLTMQWTTTSAVCNHVVLAQLETEITGLHPAAAYSAFKRICRWTTSRWNELLEGATVSDEPPGGSGAARALNLSARA